MEKLLKYVHILQYICKYSVYLKNNKCKWLLQLVTMITNLMIKNTNYPLFQFNTYYIYTENQNDDCFILEITDLFCSRFCR